MPNYWKGDDKSRIEGAAGVLAEAARLADDCAQRGPCPLTWTEIGEAQALARAAAVMLDQIREASA